jgi:hypothetical protein
MAAKYEDFEQPDEEKPLGGVEHVMVVKYTDAGERLWLERFGAEKIRGSSAVPSVSISVDDTVSGESGGLYVVGDVEGKLPGESHAGEEDAYLTKIDADGQVAWSRQFGGEDQDRALAVDRTDDGKIVVGGATWSNLFSESDIDDHMAFVARYTPSGEREAIWSPEGFGQGPEIIDLVVGADNQLYIAGGTGMSVAGKETSDDPPDPFVAKVSLDGTVSWVKLLDVSAPDESMRVALDKRGRPYLVTQSNGAFAGHQPAGKDFLSDVAIAAFDMTGQRRWTAMFGSEENDVPHGVAVDTAGRLQIVGYTQGDLAGPPPSEFRNGFVATVSTDGERLGTDYVGRHGSELYGVTAAPDGGVYVTGDTRGRIGDTRFGGFGGAVDAFVLKRTE